MNRLFLTGGSGLLGSRLIPALTTAGMAIVALDRSGELGSQTSEESLEVVVGDVLDPSTYREALGTTQAIVHLAATTGKASRKEHFETNLRGTQILLDQCRQAGVKKFLFVSSIAVKFPKETRYYYAQAKQMAEKAVRESGLDFAIVRPTIIVGRGSGPLAALSKLAGMPIVPVFGKGSALVQPIFVDDLAAFMKAILEQPRLGKGVVELGGPNVLTIKDLLLEIRCARDLRDARTLRIPLAPLIKLLGAAESIGFERLPVTAGQLSSFRFDGIIDSSELFEERRDTLKTVPEMLSLSLAS